MCRPRMSRNLAAPSNKAESTCRAKTWASSCAWPEMRARCWLVQNPISKCNGKGQSVTHRLCAGDGVATGVGRVCERYGVHWRLSSQRPSQAARDGAGMAGCARATAARRDGRCGDSGLHRLRTRVSDRSVACADQRGSGMDAQRLPDRCGHRRRERRNTSASSILHRRWAFRRCSMRQAIPNLQTALQSTDSWSWEYVLWLNLGEKIRKGEWDPAKDPIPAGVAEMVVYAKQKHVGLLAYVYPSVPFAANPSWLVKRPAEGVATRSPMPRWSRASCRTT